MPRLLITTPTYATKGGVERILAALGSRLPAHGFEVIFGLARGLRFHDPARFREALGPMKNVESVEIDGTSGTREGRIEAVRRVLEYVDPDIVLIARLFDVYPAAAELKRKGSAMRLAVTVQAFEPEYIVDAAHYGGFLDVCITSGNLVARAIEEVAGTPADRVRSIPGGVAPPHRMREPNRGDPLRLGYAGRIEQVQKRALDLVETLVALQRQNIPFTCTIAGDGSEREELQRRLTAAGVSATFVGWLDTAELYDRVYPELDVLLHFAEWEGITIAPREAMAHGVVPVVSRFTGLEAEGQFVDGINALTFPVGDTNGAASLVARLHADRDLLARLSARAGASQGGIRSEEGAIAAWAEALHGALAMPPRVATRLPPLRPDSGRLADLGVPPPIAEALRRFAGRTLEHADPGSEWPHWSGMHDEAIERRIRELGKGG